MRILIAIVAVMFFAATADAQLFRRASCAKSSCAAPAAVSVQACPTVVLQASSMTRTVTRTVTTNRVGLFGRVHRFAARGPSLSSDG